MAVDVQLMRMEINMKDSEIMELRLEKEGLFELKEICILVNFITTNLMERDKCTIEDPKKTEANGIKEGFSKEKNMVKGQNIMRIKRRNIKEHFLKDLLMEAGFFDILMEMFTKENLKTD